MDKLETLKIKYLNLVGKIPFECGDGWYNILDQLLGLVEWHNTKCDKPVKIIQIKEKFAGLRFYYNGGDDYVSGAVRMAESMAERTCDVCGCPGKRIAKDWLTTRCDKHEDYKWGDPI